MTTDSNESEWSTNTNDRYLTAPVPSAYSTSAYNTLDQNYQIINFDLSETDDWNNRIITAIRIDLLNALDNLGPMVIDTDVDYIKISANTG